MLESFNTQHEMQYERLSAEEQQKRGILGRLVGIIADFKHPTRNGRRYTEELWDKTFNDPIMKEKLDNRCVFGELGHPVDRTEIDMEKIAICLAEMPKKGNDGKLYGVFDILATPNGRILKTMCDYGCKIGVSSRGSGDTFEDYNGQETVEPDSFECECWDAVLLPAVKAARPKYVTESLNTNNKTFKTALLEELDRSSEDDRKVMEQTLTELDIDVSNDVVENIDNPPEKVDNIDEDISKMKDSDEINMAAEDTGAELMKELQETLRSKLELEKQVRSLQEQLSVCYTKENRYKRYLNQANSENLKLKEQLESLSASNTQLTESVKSASHAKITQTTQVKKLTEELEAEKKSKISLTETLKQKDSSIHSLNEALQKAQIAYKTLQEELNTKIQKLTEDLTEVKKDSKIIKTEANARITKANNLIEKYKTAAKAAVDKYISLQARRLGIKETEIKNKLNENYSFKDIEDICEDLQQRKLKVNALPFNLDSNSSKAPVKMIISESKNEILRPYDDRFDDDVDSTLTTFLN